MAGPWRGRGGRGSSGPDNGLGGRDARQGAHRSLEEGVWNPLFLFSPRTGHTTTTTTSSLPSGSRTEEERPGSWAKSSLVSAERKGESLLEATLTPRDAGSSPRVYLCYFCAPGDGATPVKAGRSARPPREEDSGRFSPGRPDRRGRGGHPTGAPREAGKARAAGAGIRGPLTGARRFQAAPQPAGPARPTAPAQSNQRLASP